ncbi:unnamed protein product, partial [marine sediment metagenome]
FISSKVLRVSARGLEGQGKLRFGVKMVLPGGMVLLFAA